MVGPTSSALQTAKTPRSARQGDRERAGVGGRAPPEAHQLLPRIAVDADVRAHQAHGHERVGDCRRDDVGAQLQRQRDRSDAALPKTVLQPAQEPLRLLGVERQQVVVHHREHARVALVVERRDLAARRSLVQRTTPDAVALPGRAPPRTASAPARRVVAATQQ